MRARASDQARQILVRQHGLGFSGPASRRAEIAMLDVGPGRVLGEHRADQNLESRIRVVLNRPPVLGPIGRGEAIVEIDDRQRPWAMAMAVPGNFSACEDIYPQINTDSHRSGQRPSKGVNPSSLTNMFRCSG